ncbi:hypothetical protein [Tersicoccus phoenicis]|nr:hypothetical protein [Tersicoccus phoenicis]
MRAAAMLMSYGGDLADATLAVLLCAQWYRESGSRLDRPRTALRPG